MRPTINDLRANWPKIDPARMKRLPADVPVIRAGADEMKAWQAREGAQIARYTEMYGKPMPIQQLTYFRPGKSS